MQGYLSPVADTVSCLLLLVGCYAGDVVFMSSYALGRCPRIWEDPLTFNPDRFLPAAEAEHHRFQFLPFGAGPRMCLGSSFALMSVTLVAASLLQKFKFSAVRPASQLLPVSYDITMNFNNTQGLHMQVEARPQQPQQQQAPPAQTQDALAAVAAAASAAV
jgi:cytochrome P450